MEGARMSDEQATIDSRPSTGGKGASASLSEAQVRVLIVDDSPWMCRILEELLSADEEIKVVGVAHDGREALRKIDELKPTLITLDVNMPGMDGGTALRHIMIRNPCPIVIISSLGSKPSTKILDFLRLGAVDFVLKPKKGEEMVHQQRKLIERIKQAATAKTGNFRRVKPPDIHLEAKGSPEVQNPCEGLVVMASGGGGYAELIRIFPLLPKDLNVSYLVLQDTSPELLVPLSEHLDLISRIDVQPLQNRAPLSGSRCYIGTSDTPTRIASMDGRYFLQLGNGLSGPSFHPEPFDSLLSSLAETFFRPCPGGVTVRSNDWQSGRIGEDKTEEGADHRPAIGLLSPAPFPARGPSMPTWLIPRRLMKRLPGRSGLPWANPGKAFRRPPECTSMSKDGPEVPVRREHEQGKKDNRRRWPPREGEDQGDIGTGPEDLGRKSSGA